MRLFFALILWLAIPCRLFAQTNYVARTANSATPPGSFNTLVGPSAGNTSMTGSYNACLGYQAGISTTSGLANTLIGYLAGPFNSTGGYNVFNGYEAGYTNSTGSQNTFIGSYAGYSSTASANTFIGNRAGISNTSGQLNTFMGYQSGQNVTTGSNNIIIGPTSGTAITDGSENVLMGYNSQAEDGLHNAIAIGSGSRVAISNALILGNQVNIGIGTSTPTARLELVSDKADDSGLRLTNLTTSSPITHSTDQFLTVNQKGEVIKARYQLRINNVSQWSDKVFSPSHTLRPLSSVASYIGQYGHLPGVPSAEEVVREGIDLVKMNATLLEKVEELTLYGIEQQARLDKLEQLVKQLLEKK